MQDILQALRSPEGPPPALRHQLQQLWGDLTSAAAALEAAQQRLPVVQLHPATQHLPAAVGTAYAAAATGTIDRTGAGMSPAAAARQQALLHPSQRHRRAQCVPYRRLLCEALSRLGLSHYQVGDSTAGFCHHGTCSRVPQGTVPAARFSHHQVLYPCLPGLCCHASCLKRITSPCINCCIDH
jgi:hypothetical protein